MAKYTIGVDFGTLSARALVCDTAAGREAASFVFPYTHGVMDECLPDGTKVPVSAALQHPMDYIEALTESVKGAVEASGVSKEDIIGIGIDFTSSTVLPVDKAMKSLCEKYPDNPHAYVKLWKHHSCGPQSARLTEVFMREEPALLHRCGDTVSTEWTLPKMLETLEEAPEVYESTHVFIEAGDWITYLMTGVPSASRSMAYCKVLWDENRGYPSGKLLAMVNPDFEGAIDKLLPVAEKGYFAGRLTEKMADKLGLMPGIAVSQPCIDAHASLPGTGVTEAGRMLLIMGTSLVGLMLTDKQVPVPGVCGMPMGGMVENLCGYEAGQSCVGDLFAWFVDNCLPAEYAMAAEKAGMSKHQYLTCLCEKQRVGEHGLLALDWWNGNRSVLCDPDLSGLLIGMTLKTKPEDIYRALIESTAFGARAIIENYEQRGVPVTDMVACGGIAGKNPFLVQVFSDVLKREIRVSSSKQSGALGSAIYAAVAAGSGEGGYDFVRDAAEHMSSRADTVYRPDPARAEAYDKLYSEYIALHDLFGRGGNDIMKRLRKLREA